jgi:O-antigen ligase
MPRPSQRTLDSRDGIELPDEFPILTQLAFYLLLASVAARAVLSEYVRDALPNPDAPRGTGPGTILVLNLLCCIPALLVLLRRSIDKHYVLRVHLSHLPMALLAASTLASVAWSSDRYLALVSATSWIAMLVVLWTMTQLVRSWQRLRVVAGVLVGILLAVAAQGIIFRTLDVPDLQELWKTDGPRILAERGWAPDSFQAQQFEKKLTSGEVYGFSASPNTYAAQLVTLAFVVVGVGLQRWKDGDESGWIGAVFLALLPALVLPFFTGSKTAFVTASMGGLLLFASLRWRETLASRHRAAYLGGLALAGLGVVAVLAVGLVRGGLPIASLNFRWSYWVGSWSAFWDRPLLGTGWANFISGYLPARVERAAEEIKDPHNLLVRFFVELGLVGGILAIAWLARLAWEATRPAAGAVKPVPSRPAAIPPPRSRELNWIAAMVVLSLVIGAAAAIDFAFAPDAWTFDLLKRVLFAFLLAIGVLLAVMRTGEAIRIDDRPAPHLSAAMTVAVAVLLLHASIDFALFETATSLIFALLVGSLAGLRSPSAAGEAKRTGLARLSLAMASLAWVAMVVFVAWPIVSAETLAWQGDQAAQRGRLNEAASLYASAEHASPVANAEFVSKEFAVRLAARDDLDRLRMLLIRQIDADPRSPSGHLARARLERGLPDPQRDTPAMLAALDEAVRLNPQELSIRLEYADALESTGRPAEAVAQLQQALRINDRLDPAEPERLGAAQLQQVRQAIERLSPAR